MFVRGPTTREYYQVCSWHITNGFNIHDLKSHLKDLHFQEQLSFLKKMACIIPRGEDKGVIGVLVSIKQTNKDSSKGTPERTSTQLNGSSSHIKNADSKTGVSGVLNGSLLRDACDELGFYVTAKKMYMSKDKIHTKLKTALITPISSIALSMMRVDLHPTILLQGRCNLHMNSS